MESSSVLKLFPDVSSGELKSVTLQLSPDVHEVAYRNASALRISKRRWLELLIENAVNEHGGGHAGDRHVSANHIPKTGLGKNQVYSENEGLIASKFDLLRDQEGDE